MSGKSLRKKNPYVLANFEKFYLVFSILVGIAILAFLLQTLVIRNDKVRSMPVDLLFTQGEKSTDPNVNFKLMLNARKHKISFVSVSLYFDPQILQMTREISFRNSPLSRVVSVTPMDQANEDGMVDIVLAQNSGSSSPQGTFELAGFTFANIGGQPSEITVVDEETQVVDNSTKDLPFTTTYVTVN